MGFLTQMATGSAPKTKFKVLMAPAEWPDGSLWFPERLTRERLLEQKTRMSEYLYSCNYQQDPVSQENRKFRDEWWHTWIDIPPGCDYYLTLDPAGDGTTKTPSRTAIVVT